MPSTPYSGSPTKNLNPMLRLKSIDSARYIVNKSSRPADLSRYHGGHRRDNHPYISGYWYFVINLPERIFGSEGSNTMEHARAWMFATAESFTPPTRSLTKFDVPAMGGMGSSYISGQEITRTFSVTFREYQELPIMNILQTWTSVMDPNTGTSVLAGDEFIPANYKGSAFAALCKPTTGTRTDAKLANEDIEQIFYFDGVWPDAAPWDTFASDVATNDGAAVSVNFNFDGFPLLKDTQGVISQFLTLVESNKIDETYRHYQKGITKSTTPDSRSGGEKLNGNAHALGIT